MSSPPSSKSPYYNLGQFQRPITTKSSECQTWFNRGITWIYAFHLEEATKCFQHAIAHDSDCAIAYWGLAYASGPHYNKSWELMDKEDLVKSTKVTHDAARDANSKRQQASPVEQALITAIQSRYPDDTPTKDFSKWNAGYAEAMEKAYNEFGDDLDVAAFYADSLMNLTPWAMWDLRTGKPGKGARTIEAKQVLEKALKSDASWKHPGILHLYVHLIEMSPEPELAMNAADHLRTLIPEAGHLCHMPSHLDILVGDYRAAIAANNVACTADEKYLAQSGPNNFFTMYRLHNYASLIYAAMFAGKYTAAMDAVSKMESSAPESMLRITSPPMADWNEVAHTTRAHVLIRFGRWDEILALPLPEDQALFIVTTATLHYAKAIAHAAQGNIASAQHHQTLFLETSAVVPPTRLIFPNKCTSTLAIAKEMLAGEVLYRQRDFDKAFTHLAKAVELDDSLIYSEPWAWMLPTRHAFAALLLEQGHLDRAAALYRADLGFDRALPRARQHPNNVWALHGYHECLVRLGRVEEADLLDLQLRVAKATAEVDVTASCFCRVGMDDGKKGEEVNGSKREANGCC